MKKYDYLVIGAGLFGAVIAERIANNLGKKVLVLERRNHIGGNCFSDIDEATGIEYHKYGTHIFHTEDECVWKYIKKFTDFNSYRHQVLTTYKNRVYQMPINLETINSFYGLNLKPYEAEVFIEKERKRCGITNPKNLEQKAMSLIGKRLYHAFIRGYTIKQWGRDPKTLPAGIFTRLPIRYNYNESYFNCRWQGIPIDGYTKIFERLLKSKNICIELGVDYFKVRDGIKVNKKTIFTGPIDKYFNFKYGRLQWRTITFEKEEINTNDYQGTSVMNYAERKVPFTRIHEPKHLHEERKYPSKTIIFKEYSHEGNSDGDFYPIADEKNMSILSFYKKLAKKEKMTVFGGRLADYKYYDMDHVIKNALLVFNKIAKGK